jgi:hypothetical protein
MKLTFCSIMLRSAVLATLTSASVVSYAGSPDAQSYRGAADKIAEKAQQSELEIEYEARRGPWRYLIGGSGSRVEASSAASFANKEQTQDTFRLFGESAASLGPLHTSLGFMAQDSSNVEDVEWASRAT